MHSKIIDKLNKAVNTFGNTEIYPIILPSEKAKKIKIRDIKNLKQLPVKQKIDDNTVITKELIESFKYTPEELKLIKNEYKLYEQLDENTNILIEYLDLGGISEETCKYGLDIEIININNSIYALEYIILRDELDGYFDLNGGEPENIFDKVKDPNVYFLRVLGNYERYDHKICSLGSDYGKYGTFDNLDEIINIINGKTIKESLKIIDALI